MTRRDAGGPSRVVVHAGMPKAGSTSLQYWLGGNGLRLREQGIVPVRLTGAGGAAPRWEPVVEGTAWSPASLMGPGFGRAEAAVRFEADLRALLGTASTLIVSAEGLHGRLWAGDPALLATLERLAADVLLELVIFVRPQHVAVESGWRQWGFRTAVAPSRWMADRARRLDHRWLFALAERLPDIRVRILPAVDARGAPADVVARFATDVLDLPPEDPTVTEPRPAANAGLPLAVCAHLSRRDDPRLWRGMHDNERFDRLKDVLPDDLRDLDQREPLVGLVRERIAAWASQRFGASNEAFLAEMGWPAEGWPAPPRSSATIEAPNGRAVTAPPDALGGPLGVDRLIALVPGAAARRRLDRVLDRLAAEPRKRQSGAIGEP